MRRPLDFGCGLWALQQRGINRFWHIRVVVVVVGLVLWLHFKWKCHGKQTLR